MLVNLQFISWNTDLITCKEGKIQEDNALEIIFVMFCKIFTDIS